MDKQVKSNVLAVSKTLNAFLALFCVGLLIAVVVLSVTIFAISNDKTTKFVPPEISKAFTVGDGYVDENYLSLMADYFVHLKYDVTPASVVRNYGLLLNYVPSERWSKIQPLLIADAKKVEKDNISSRFVPKRDGSLVSLNNLQIKQKGTLYKSVGNRDLKPDLVNVVVQLAHNNGLIELIDIYIEEVKE